MEIIIKLALFTVKQTVFLKYSTGAIEELKIPQKDLASFIASQDNVTKVHCFGNEQYGLKLQETCLTKYKLDNINFYINK